MAWKETCVIEERLKFIADVLEGNNTFSDICKIYGISRKTGYKYINRFKKDGIDSLKNVSRAPRTNPKKVPEEIISLIIKTRKSFPFWGPKKIIPYLKKQHSYISKWPARSTVGKLLKKNDLIKTKKRTIHKNRETQPLSHADSPNKVWTVDFKGWFLTMDKKQCIPLTVCDANSRYLLECKIVDKQCYQRVREIFEQIFKRYGVPYAIRSDNGPPFATTGKLKLSRLSVWWLKLGIRTELIKPGHPEQNGRHERLHRTLKNETANPPKNTLKLQQLAFNRFRKKYNNVRPHEALNFKCPAEVYRKSNKKFDRRKSIKLIFPENTVLRSVRHNGYFKWKGKLVALSETLAKETIGMNEINDRYSIIYLGEIKLGIIDINLNRVFMYGGYTYENILKECKKSRNL